ncbi:terminase large subunit protein [Rhizobium phage RHph_I1_18]|nr:terminase large subunit protein [Rhizobium phage RHph_I1_18]
MAQKKRYYNGNPNLPRAGEVKDWDEWKAQELLKCESDPVYFAEQYFRIVHVDKGLIPFQLYEYQKRAIRTMQDNRYMLMAASRQCGKTSVATVIVLHAALFNKNKKIGLLANKAPTAREILKRIQRAYEYLPDWLKGGVKEWNKSSVEFENGSIIIADATEGDSIRGHSLFMLYIDEMAFVENWDDFAQSVLPTLSSGETTKIVMTSTPNGLNHFYYYYEGAKKQENGYQLIEVPWWEVPGRDENWRVKALETLNGDEMKFAQEYAIEFLGSSGTLINGQALKLMRAAKPLYQTKEMRKYVEPVPGHIYALTADVSRGKGLDYSAFHVIDITTSPFQQVFTYRNNMIAPPDYASMINQVGRHYNNAHVLIELNDLGETVSDILYMTYEYPEVLTTENAGRAGKRISAGYAKKIDRGIRTTKPTKALGCGMLKLIVEQQKLPIVDHFTIEELKTFSQKGTTYEAESGNHDDCVMALVLFAWLTEQDYFKLLVDKDIMKEIRENTEEEDEDYLLPLGILNDGQIDFIFQEDQLGSLEVSSSEFDRWMSS